MSNKIKGNILEDLVALMHEMPGMVVEKRRKLPVVRGNKARKREVDVLITSQVLGYKVQLAFGCKNEAKALDTNAVDNFAGILEDVGIPLQYGILVSAKGYTADAQDAAAARGIRTLVFEGLSADRLNREINAALKAVIYLLVSQFNFSMLPYVPDGWTDDGPFITAVLDRDDEPLVTEILTAVWQLWVSGKIPDTIGEHLIRLAPKKPEAHWIAVGAVTVTGWMASTPGTVSQSVLKDTRSKTIDRVHVSAKFDEIKGPLTLEPVASETALRDLINKEHASLVIRVRVPRIVSDVGYWPPTNAAAQKVKALLDAGKKVTFDDIEGSNILEAWRFK